MSALLGSVLGNMGKVAEYIADCGKMSIGVLPPDINHSNTHFHVDGKNIRFGLLALKNVGKLFAEQIVRERKISPFTSFDDFVSRMSRYDVNKRQIETLIKAGTFDSLGVFRSQLLASYEKILENASESGRGNLEGQLDMFSMAPEGVIERPSFEYPDIPEFSPRQLLMLEKECSGMSFSGHLLDGYSKHIASLSHTSLADLNDTEQQQKYPERSRITCVGMIGSVTLKNTKNDERMAFFTLEDKFSSIECIAFPKAYERIYSLIRVDSAVVVNGTVSARDDEVKILVGSMQELIENASYRDMPAKSTVVQAPTDTQKKKDETLKIHDGGKLFVRVPSLTSPLTDKVKNLIALFEGSTQVGFYDTEKGTYSSYSARFDLTPFTFAEMKGILGEENVIYH
jgi:DNA polymerase-3 subunit alpha